MEKNTTYQNIMAGSVNIVHILGNISSDIKKSDLKNGKYAVNFSIATNRDWKDSNGEKHEETEFHSIVAFNGNAEHILKYCEKGKKVFVTGRLQTRNWENEQGEKRYKTEIVVEQITFVNPKKSGESDDSESFTDTE